MADRPAGPAALDLRTGPDRRVPACLCGGRVPDDAPAPCFALPAQANNIRLRVAERALAEASDRPHTPTRAAEALHWGHALNRQGLRPSPMTGISLAYVRERSTLSTFRVMRRHPH